MNSDVLSTKIEAELREIERFRNNELCSAKLEDRPRAPLKDFERPLV